ncbi:MAG: rhomboid family intramembrane serine protease [Pseudanabaenaceae cyanobacterium]
MAKQRSVFSEILAEIKEQVNILGGFLVLMWLIEIVDQTVFRQRLDQFGIYPREIIGLRGILFAPFLHANFIHLAANTVSFLILGWLVMLRNTKDFWAVSLISGFVSGLGTWLFGRPALHIGASGMIFGYFGYLLLSGYFERSIPSIFISLFVGLSYGGMIWGIFPNQPYISWEGHLFGFIGGAIAAKLLAKKTSQPPSD